MEKDMNEIVKKQEMIDLREITKHLEQADIELKKIIVEVPKGKRGTLERLGRLRMQIQEAITECYLIGD